MGVRPHQVVLLLGATSTLAWWLVAERRAWWLLATALTSGALALRVSAGDTAAELVHLGLRQSLRSRWRQVDVFGVDTHTCIAAASRASFRCYELEHRGRLDLTGADHALGESLRDVADALAQRSGTSRFSLHVVAIGGDVITVLVLAPEVTPPSGWRVLDDPTRLVSAAPAVLERWSYVRRDETLVRCYRVFDFSAVRETRPLLESLQRAGSASSLSLHVEVLSSSRARRVSARAAHQIDSDVAAATAAGFRRSARTSARQRRVAERETLVADGRALLRLGVYVTIEASTLSALRTAHDELWRHAHDDGLRLERGWGRQYAWWSAQLPGSPA